MLFIDISAFMGENNPNYQGLELYFQKSMNPQNIVPKVSEVFAQSFVPRNIKNQKFIDELIYNGKIVTLQDAFLPSFPDYLKRLIILIVAPIFSLTITKKQKVGPKLWLIIMSVQQDTIRAGK